MATLWAAVLITASFGYHIPEPSTVLSVTVGGHPYAGHPPALTFAQRDGPIWLVAVIIIGVALALGVLDLTVRTIRRTPRPGLVAIVVGALVTLFSLFGLLLGLLALGTIGVLLILSGLPINSGRLVPAATPSWPAGPARASEAGHRDPDIRSR